MTTKVKDYQPPYQEEREGLSLEQLEGNPQGWDRKDIKDITDEASHRDEDGVLRQTLRGEESQEIPMDRDITSAVNTDDTPQNREQSKIDKAGAANQNG